MLSELTLEAVRAAAVRIAPYIIRTPVLRARHGGVEIFAKAESLQSIGAFKIRGAFSLMTTLDKNVPGVVAHSSGNHAQAVARAAKVLGLKAVIVMPSDAPKLKLDRTRADGAEIVLVSADSAERIAKAKAIEVERGFVSVPPYDHPLIAAGQGTAALELCEDLESFDRFYCPVSGGGLLAGCATVMKALRPNVEVIGVEPEDGNDMLLSRARGERVTIPPPKTIADGLRVRTPGEKTWPVIEAKVDRIVTVTDEALLDGIAWAADQLRVVLEPSGAASLAACLAEGQGRSAVLLSGGNIDPQMLVQALERRLPARLIR